MDNSGKYINPFTDFGFKKLFGTEFNKELLIDFLNQVLGDKEHIKDLTYLNLENLGNLERDRRAIFDVYCENEIGEKFIIELQNVNQAYFKDRSIYYATFPIQSQAPKGSEWQYSLKTVYTICILNFSFEDGNNTSQCVREVQLIDKKTNKVFYDKLMFIYLEMPRFNKAEDELVSRFDKWLYVIKNLNRLHDRPVKLQERVFQKLFKEAEIAKLKPKEMETYQESLKAYRDNQNTMEYAKSEARKEGLEEGLKEGLEEGLKEGIQQGEHIAKVETAKAMKQEGLSTKLISKVTGLSVQEIAKL